MNNCKYCNDKGSYYTGDYYVECSCMDGNEHMYTYRSRGFSIGCQPKHNFVRHEENKEYKFGILIYNVELNKIEIEDYELIYLGKKK
jgi:hypothetical protein